MRRRHAVLLAVAIAVGANSCSEVAPEPPPRRTLTVKSGVIRTVPGLPSAQASALTKEIGTFLETLYTTAFIRPKAAGPTPLPSAYVPTERLVAFFSAGGRTVLRAHADAFTLGPDLDLLTGTLTYSGGITRSPQSTTALLQIHLTGRASRTDESTPVILIGQTGTMLIGRTGAGWLVREFDLKFRTVPAPTPTPT
jgi:hypothetical protein